MLCLLHIGIELSVRAKGDLLMREAGVEIPPDREIDAQFEELAYLRSSIGPTALLALAPPARSDIARPLGNSASGAREVGFLVAEDGARTAL